MRRLGLIVVVCLVVAATMAQSTVAPNAYAGAAGQGGLNTIMRNSGNPRCYQVMYAASELGAIPVGYQIVGLSWRMYSAGVQWPPAGGASWTDYEVRVSTPVTTVGTMSTTFAANTGLNEVLVYDGAFSVPEAHFLLNPAPPHQFGTPQTILFQTPFTYPGGDLLLDIRHPGGNHTDSSGFLDAVTSTGPGYGTTVRGLSQTAWPTPTTGAFTSGYITQIHFVPEPASLALLALGGLLALRRR